MTRCMNRDSILRTVENLECALAINNKLRLAAWEREKSEWGKENSEWDDLVEQHEFIFAVFYTMIEEKKTLWYRHTCPD